jgi:1,4-dihydroxy-2-naphthoate octaprenyltransferase
VGVFISYFYTAPPLDLGARGLGEIAVGMSFFMLVFFSFYVATGTFDWHTFSYTGVGWNILTWEIFIFAVIVGTLVGLMRLTDSMSGQEAHIANGEKSIAVRFGLEGAAKIAKAFIVFAYLLFAVMFILNPVYILLFLTLPLTLKVWRIMTEMKGDWTIVIPPFFFGTAFLAEILFIAAVCVQYVFSVAPLF